MHIVTMPATEDSIRREYKGRGGGRFYTLFALRFGTKQRTKQKRENKRTPYENYKDQRAAQ